MHCKEYKRKERDSMTEREMWLSSTAHTVAPHRTAPLRAAEFPVTANNQKPIFIASESDSRAS